MKFSAKTFLFSLSKMKFTKRKSAGRSALPFLNTGLKTMVFVFEKMEMNFRSVIMISSAFDKAGAVSGFVVVIYDSTERHKIQRRHAYDRRKNPGCLKKAFTGNYISTADGKLLDCNLLMHNIRIFFSKRNADHTIENYITSPEYFSDIPPTAVQI